MTPFARPRWRDLRRGARDRYPSSGFEAQGQAETVTRGVPTNGRRLQMAPSSSARSLAASSTKSCCPLQLAQSRLLDRGAHQPTPSKPMPRSRFGRNVATEPGFTAPSICAGPPDVSTARFWSELEKSRGGIGYAGPSSSWTSATGNHRHRRRTSASPGWAVSHGKPHRPHQREMPQVVQPEPFSFGETGRRAFHADQTWRKRKAASASSTAPPSNRWSPVSTSPWRSARRHQSQILQGIKSAGALQGELVLQ